MRVEARTLIWISRSYGYYYLMFATFPQLFPEKYGFSTGLAGLVSHFS